jgi:hypothetical protein
VAFFFLLLPLCSPPFERKPFTGVMDINIIHADNLPQKAYISICVGDTRRQAPYEGNEPFRFPSAKNGHLVVDVFEKVGTAQVSLLGIAENGKKLDSIHINRSDGGLMELGLNIRVTDTASAKEAEPQTDNMTSSEDVQSKLTALEERRCGLQSRMSSVLAYLEEKAGAAQPGLSTCGTSLVQTDNMTSSEDVQSKLTALEERRCGLQSRMSSVLAYLEEKTAAAKPELSTCETSLVQTDSMTSSGDAQSKLTALEERRCGLQSLMCGVLTYLEEKADAAKLELSNCETSLVQERARSSILQDDLKKLKTELAAKDITVRDVMQQMQFRQASQEQLEQKHAALHERLEMERTEHKALHATACEELEQKHAASQERLEVEHEKLKTLYGELEQKHADLRQRLEREREEFKAMHATACEELEQKHAASQERLEVECEKLKTLYGELEQKHADLRQCLEREREEFKAKLNEVKDSDSPSRQDTLECPSTMKGFEGCPKNSLEGLNTVTGLEGLNTLKSSEAPNTIKSSEGLQSNRSLDTRDAIALPRRRVLLPSPQNGVVHVPTISEKPTANKHDMLSATQSELPIRRATTVNLRAVDGVPRDIDRRIGQPTSRFLLSPTSPGGPFGKQPRTVPHLAVQSMTQMPTAVATSPFLQPYRTSARSPLSTSSSLQIPAARVVR